MSKALPITNNTIIIDTQQMEHKNTITSHIAKTFKSTSITQQSDIFASCRHQIDVDPRAVDTCDLYTSDFHTEQRLPQTSESTLDDDINQYS